MKKQRYQEYLKSGEWDLLRGLKLKSAKYACEGCGESGLVLDIHHLTYERIGFELLTDLVVLCRECHEKVHNPKVDEWNEYLTLKSDVRPKHRIAKDIELMNLVRSI